MSTREQKIEALASKMLLEQLPPLFEMLDNAGITYSDEQIGLVADDMFKAGILAGIRLRDEELLEEAEDFHGKCLDEAIGSPWGDDD